MFFSEWREREREREIERETRREEGRKKRGGLSLSLSLFFLFCFFSSPTLRCFARAGERWDRFSFFVKREKSPGETGTQTTDTIQGKKLQVTRSPGGGRDGDHFPFLRKNLLLLLLFVSLLLNSSHHERRPPLLLLARGEPSPQRRRPRRADQHVGGQGVAQGN